MDRCQSRVFDDGDVAQHLLVVVVVQLHPVEKPEQDVVVKPDGPVRSGAPLRSQPVAEQLPYRPVLGPDFDIQLLGAGLEDGGNEGIAGGLLVLLFFEEGGSAGSQFPSRPSMMALR